MASVTLNSTIFERLAAGLYGIQLGSATLVEATNAALFLSTVEPGSDGVNTLANVLYKRDFGNQSDHAVAVSMVANMGITGALATSSVTLVENALGGVTADHKGEVVMTIINKLSAAEADATYGASAKAFNLQVKAALDYAAHNVGDVSVKSLLPIFHLDPMTAAGADSMRLTGNEDVTINFTDPANQITGMDLNGDGIIKADGVENHITGKAADFEIVDAYSRNPLNHGDTANNFLGDIEFHGEGFDGDGTNTDGNIVLGGLGIDNIFGGIGNDFLAGGNVAQGRDGYDMLHGGRNADFFFAEFNPIRSTDGKQLYIDGGSTADDTAAGTHSSQDSDWLLFEATDDDEPVTVLLEEESLTLNPFDDVDVTSRSGKSMDVEDVENFDASGNLYGFLDGVNVKIGARAVDGRDTSDAAVGSNYGYGSSAQLYVSGSEVSNIIVGGYDNDRINGNDGDDLLMGGNLNFLKNPNLAGIWNNGQDEIYGGAGDDNIVFETDGGIYEGGSVANNDKDKFDNNDSDTTEGDDTLWLTREAFGKKSAGDVTSDGTLRIDLAVGKEGGIDNAAGYGGADKAARTGNYTADQTNYKAGFARAQVQDMDNVIATGLGAVDYLAAGANDPELQFANQQNHFAFSGNLDLRGTAGDNILYAVDGSDVIEGRQGNDSLSGGNGNDDFYFTLAGEDGDGVDVIHRQSDKNGDNLWDTDADGNGLYEKDFGQAGAAVTANSKLTLTLTDAAHPSDLTGFPVNGVVFKLDGVSYTVSLASGTQSTYAAFKDGLNAALDANATLARLNAVLNGDNTITITDPNGKTFVSVGYTFIDNVVPPAGTLTWNQLVGDPSSSQSKDRLIYKAYEDRLDNEGVDDDSFLGSTISLGVDSYAEDLVIGFADEDGNGKATTRIAEDQAYTLRFTNLTTQDKVQVVVNGVKYSLQVGVDLDGNIIAAEDGVGDTQAGIQAAFLQRLNDFINSFMDDDTSAGAVDSFYNGSDTLTLTQRVYNGEQTVFMVKPTVTLQNLSGGEAAKVAVTNVSQHEVELLDFDGRNGELNSTNVLFIGQEGVDNSRATLETAKTAGGQTITGKEAIVIDVGANNLQDVVFGTTTAVPNNTATNAPLAGTPNGFAVHGDDFLLGGAGLDTINGGTGDDRIEGSLGGNGTTTWDTLDGGKNFYAVQVLGEPQARVYILNKWEAANPAKVAALSALTISSIQLIDQSEDGLSTMSGVFDDTLQFSQSLFTPGVTRFTVNLNNFVNTGTATAPVIELQNDGAGTVGVDVNGDGVIEALNGWTRFTNFENIRTVSGVGNAVAGDGQGNDTLDATLLSTAAGGISYDLTKGGSAGEVRYSTDAFVTAPTAPTLPGTGGTDRPQSGDFESLVIRVDGVENVLTGTGNDLLLIDESEAAKDNVFNAGLGVDRIEYHNNFGTPIAEPTVTIRVNSGADTDTVTMKGGRVGTLNTASGGAVDTLVGVEYLALTEATAQSSREDDLIDVRSIATGAVVDYTNGEIRSAAAGGAVSGIGVQLVIENIVQMENVIADGDDTVIVADADTMNNNARSDEGVDAKASVDIQLATFLDFDTFTDSKNTARKAFGKQSTSEIANVINQNQFKFDLGTVGVDTVDYSNETGRIVAVMNFTPNDPNKFVLVDGNTSAISTAAQRDVAFADSESRIDKLVNVERIVASQGDSIIDLTNSGRDSNVVFSYNQPDQTADFIEGKHKETANDRQINTVRVSDANNQAALGNVDLLEYRDLGASTTISQATATWNSVQGSDYREYVQLTQWENNITHTMTLRGGANEVNYNERTDGIHLYINAVDGTADGVAHQYLLGVQHLDAVGAMIGGYGTFQDTITGYNQANKIGGGSGANAGGTANTMRIEASQGDQDYIDVAGVNAAGVFLIGNIETSGSSVVTATFIDPVTALPTGSGLTLSGFEFLWDSPTNDTYTITDLSNFVSKLTLIDFNQTGNAGHSPPSTDRDSIKLTNGSFESAVIRPPISHAITISPALHMGDLTANDLQWLGLNSDVFREALGTGLSEGFDFQVLDISDVTNQVNITAAGSVAGVNDELIVGGLTYLNKAGTAITNFDTLSLTNASAGTAFDFDLDAAQLQDGTNAKIVGFDGDMGTLDLSRIIDGRTTTITVTDLAGVGATVIGSQGNDTITGSAGIDTLRGAGGNDTYDGGTATEVRTIQLFNLLDGVAGNTVLVTLNGNSSALTTVTEGVEIPVAAGEAAIGAALAAKINANLAAVNTLAAWTTGGAALTGVTYTAGGTLTFTFASGVNVSAGESIVVSDTDAGTFAASGESTINGGSGGRDTFVFESTAAKNGADTINNFVAGTAADVNDDILDFTAFLGGASNNGAGLAVNFTAGLDLSGAANVGVVFNKASLSASDVQATAAASKIAVENNSKAVVLVSADANGASDGTNTGYSVYYIEDTDTTAATSYTVTLVGTINSAVELNAADFFAGTDSFA